MRILKSLERYMNLLKSTHENTKISIDQSSQILEMLSEHKANSMTAISKYRFLSISGFDLLLDPSSFVDKALIDHGHWEPEQICYISQYFSRYGPDPSFTFLDIGAYWGLYSLVASKMGISDIHLFESDRINYAQCLANQFLNSAVQKINSYNLGVSEKAGRLTFWDSGSHPDGNRGGVGVVAAGENTREVEVVSVDEFFGYQDKIVVAKIDVEGHEAAVIRGMKETISNCRVFLQVECFPHNQDEISLACSEVGLRKVHQINVDTYYSNFDENDIISEC